MGCHYHVFLGPYLEVFNPYVPRPEKIQGCSNPQCKKHKERSSDQFCPKCGTQIGLVEILKVARKEFDCYEEFDGDPFMELRFEGRTKEQENYMLLKSNRTNRSGRTFSEESEILPIDREMPNAEMLSFALDFEKEIRRITDVFGEKNVKVKWGAIAYWS